LFFKSAAVVDAMSPKAAEFKVNSALPCWPDEIKMDPEVKKKIDALWKHMDL